MATRSTPPHPILGDIRVREAIASAIDYKTILKDVLKGLGFRFNESVCVWLVKVRPAAQIPI